MTHTLIQDYERIPLLTGIISSAVTKGLAGNRLCDYEQEQELSAMLDKLLCRWPLYVTHLRSVLLTL